MDPLFSNQSPTEAILSVLIYHLYDVIHADLKIINASPTRSGVKVEILHPGPLLLLKGKRLSLPPPIIPDGHCAIVVHCEP